MLQRVQGLAMAPEQLQCDASQLEQLRDRWVLVTPRSAHSLEGLHRVWQSRLRITSSQGGEGEA